LSTIEWCMCPVIHVILTLGWENKNQQRTYTEDHIEKKGS
jgi:hypothetical protein